MKRKRTNRKSGLTLRPIFYKTILGLNILAVLALILSYLAPITDPRDYMFIALLGFSFYGLVLANLIFGIYWIFTSKRLLSLISLISLLAGLGVINKFYHFQTAKCPLPEKSAGLIRLMNYNVHSFTGIELLDNQETKDTIFKIIKSQRPDVIAMEEFMTIDSNRVDSLKRMFEYKYSFAVPFKHNRNVNELNVLFSKYPIVKTGTVSAPKMLNINAIYADLKVNRDTIRVYCIHLAAVAIKGQEKNRYLSGNNVVDNSDFILGRMKVAFLSRSFQVERIKRNIDSCRTPYVIMGDFNDTPNSFAVNTLSDDIKNAVDEKGNGFVTTYYSRFPLQIDYILTSNAFNVMTYEALDRKVSDHKPVVADVKLNKVN